MKRMLLCFMSLMLFASMNAQTRKRNPATSRSSSPTRSAKRLVETLRTADGKEVHLYDDMTYDISPGVAPQGSSIVSFTVKAGVITNAGDVKPVARRTFIIFKEDINPTLKMVIDSMGKPLNVFRLWLSDEYRELDQGRTYIAALEKVRPLIVATFTTDFEGNALIQIPTSDSRYWLFGYSQKLGRSSCMWYLEFKPNKNRSLVLDNNNSAYCG